MLNTILDDITRLDAGELVNAGNNSLWQDSGLNSAVRTAAARIAVKTAWSFALENCLPDKILFCCFSHEDMRLYRRLLEAME